MIFVFFIAIALLLMYYNSGKKYLDPMDVHSPILPQAPVPPDTSLYKATGYASPSIASPSDLLPSDANSQWAALNPVSQNSPNMPDLLQAGYHIGMDTIGQTMKNANLQLRSDPIIPKKEIGPWNMSTIEPDLMRVPLEVGCR